MGFGGLYRLLSDDTIGLQRNWGHLLLRLRLLGGLLRWRHDF
jgi:hypothetical protein